MKGGFSDVYKLWIALWICCAYILALPVHSRAQAEAIDVLLAAPAASPQPFIAAAQLEGVEIRAVSISGLELLSEDIVLTGLTIKEGDILVGNLTTKLNDAADALYATGWFRGEPELSLDSYEGGAILKVEVLENPPYKGTRLSGNTLFSTERLLREVEGTVGEDGQRVGARLTPGEVINAKKLVSALDAILGVYQGAGYLAAGIADYTFMYAGPDEGTVDIKLSEGIIEEVLIIGANRTRESVIRSQITHLRPERILTRGDLEQDMNQVYSMGLFETVNPELEPSLKEGYVKVIFQVVEAPTGQAGLGLGYSTINGLQGTISYNEKNLFGSGKQAGVLLLFSRSAPGFEVNYSDPYATENSFWSVGIFNLHHRQQRFPGLPYESELQIDTAGISATYGQHLNDYDSWQTSFSITDYDYDIVKGDPFRGYRPRQRARLAASGETRKLGVTFSHDTRDNPFSSTQGYLGRVTSEVAGFGGDFDFNKWTFEGREFYPLGKGTLGFRQRLGLANGEVPIYEEYRMGGVNSIRGTSEDLVTGTHSFLSNIEYRYPLSDVFGVVGFWDYGAAGETFSGMDHAVGAGIGARIKIPAMGIGAVRLDYGWELAGEVGSNNRFHFFLGEMF
ncbi:BamA/TamA family outer membrane protein [bacterium]|nr:BamA/TamA family outer membrane protein [bacterium]